MRPSFKEALDSAEKADEYIIKMHEVVSKLVEQVKLHGEAIKVMHGVLQDLVEQ